MAVPTLNRQFFAENTINGVLTGFLASVVISFGIHWFAATLLAIGISAQLMRLKNKADIPWLLDAWSTLLPARVIKEDMGDFVEDINRRIALGQRVLPWVRCGAAIFWTGVNAIGYLMSNLLGKRSGA